MRGRRCVMVIDLRGVIVHLIRAKTITLSEVNFAASKGRYKALALARLGPVYECLLEPIAPIALKQLELNPGPSWY